jgi:hypothetical protein
LPDVAEHANANMSSKAVAIFEAVAGQDTTPLPPLIELLWITTA